MNLRGVWKTVMHFQRSEPSGFLKDLANVYVSLPTVTTPRFVGINVRLPPTQMPGAIRCRYCVEANNFKLMMPQSDGEWFLCLGCGHVIVPNHPRYRCNCQNCLKLRNQSVKIQKERKST
jgi:hypothetical protein